MSSKVLLIGPFPPPAGGVSIHLQRLTRLIGNEFEVDFIDEAREIKNEYFNLRPFKLLGYLNKIRESSVLFVHSGPDILKAFHIASGKIFRKKVILTVHAYPRKKGVLLHWLDKSIFNLADIIICVNSEIAERLKLPLHKSIIKNAFIPPDVEEEPEIPLYIKEWITKKKKNGRLIVSSNAYRLDTFNKQDLYGLDLCIEAAKKLIRDKYPFSFIFNISTIDDHKNLFVKYLRMVSEIRIEDDFLLINEQLSFVKLAEQSDIVLRLTNTDGDALTVREALFLGKTVIASDVVERPAGTLLFRSRDADDLAERLTETAGMEAFTLKQAYNEVVIRTFYIELIEKTLAPNQPGADDFSRN